STAKPTTAFSSTNKYFAQQFTTGLLNPGDHDQDGNVLHRFSWKLQTALGPFIPGPEDEDGGAPEVESVFEWRLMSDVGGTPGGLLTAPGQLSAYPSGIAVFYYAANPVWSDPVLQANTSYWLALRFLYVGGGATLGQYANLPVTTDTATTGSGSLGALMQATGTMPISSEDWTGLTGRAVLQVQVESVPEPSSAGLLILGMGCWLAKRRRSSFGGR
ncbi:MAG: hypothetical protein RLZZ112_251, partial [Verrucomicrobiota bacterium]